MVWIELLMRTFLQDDEKGQKDFFDRIIGYWTQTFIIAGLLSGFLFQQIFTPPVFQDFGGNFLSVSSRTTMFGITVTCAFACSLLCCLFCVLLLCCFSVAGPEHARSLAMRIFKLQLEMVTASDSRTEDDNVAVHYPTPGTTGESAESISQKNHPQPIALRFRFVRGFFGSYGRQHLFNAPPLLLTLCLFFTIFCIGLSIGGIYNGLVPNFLYGFAVVCLLILIHGGGHTVAGLYAVLKAQNQYIEKHLVSTTEDKDEGSQLKKKRVSRSGSYSEMATKSSVMQLDAEAATGEVPLQLFTYGTNNYRFPYTEKNSVFKSSTGKKTLLRPPKSRMPVAWKDTPTTDKMGETHNGMYIRDLHMRQDDSVSSKKMPVQSGNDSRGHAVSPRPVLPPGERMPAQSGNDFRSSGFGFAEEIRPYDNVPE